MEIEQVWSYGKERGADFFSPYICNVEYYNEGHYMVHSGGIAYDAEGKELASGSSLVKGGEPYSPFTPVIKGYWFKGYSVSGEELARVTRNIEMTLTYTDNLTGVEEVEAENAKVQGIYDLQGRKVKQPTKGIYIIDGKKTFVK